MSPIDRDALRKKAGKTRPDDWKQIQINAHLLIELLDALEQAEARIRAVREMHEAELGYSPLGDSGAILLPAESICSLCRDQHYPCDTIRALDA